MPQVIVHGVFLDYCKLEGNENAHCDVAVDKSGHCAGDRHALRLSSRENQAILNML